MHILDQSGRTSTAAQAMVLIKWARHAYNGRRYLDADICLTTYIVEQGFYVKEKYDFSH